MLIFDAQKGHWKRQDRWVSPKRLSDSKCDISPWVPLWGIFLGLRKPIETFTDPSQGLFVKKISKISICGPMRCWRLLSCYYSRGFQWKFYCRYKWATREPVHALKFITFFLSLRLKSLFLNPLLLLLSRTRQETLQSKRCL